MIRLSSGLAFLASAAIWTALTAGTSTGGAASAEAASCPPDGAQQVWIPGGTFRFGTDDAYPEERPASEVTVGGFWIDRYEVTNERFARFVAETGYVTVAERRLNPAEYPGIPPEKLEPGSAVFSAPEVAANGHGANASRWTFVPGANWRHPFGPGSSSAGRESFPVVHVAYEDALAYARWAGRDLPSEVEWEYAARGGSKAKPGDDAPTADVGPDGRYLGNTWQGLFPVADEGKDGYAGLAPVGCFAANGYDLHDMTGNVWEWTSSYYRPDHRDTAPGNFHDPRQPGVPVRVIKGGSYLCSRNFCWRYRPAARHAQDVSLGTGHIGFRTVSRAPAPRQKYSGTKKKSPPW